MTNLHLRSIKEVVILVPSLPEQVTIIQIVDLPISKEQQAKEAAEAVLEEIDLLKNPSLSAPSAATPMTHLRKTRQNY